MGLRDIVLALVCYGALPIIPFRPFLGLLMFSWLAYMRPQDLSWVMRSATLSQYVAVATLAGLGLSIVLPRVVPRERLATLRLQTFWLIALLAWVFLCCQTAVVPVMTQKLMGSFRNTIIIAVITTGLVRSPQRFRLMIMVIGMSLGALGLKYALYATLRGGSVFTGGPGGFMVDNNSFALCLNMALPLLAGIAMVEETKAIRVSALVLAVGTSLTIVFTLSRGGLLTLAMVALLLVWMSGKRVLSAAFLLVCVAGFFLFANDDFQQLYFDRTSTIKNYDEDDSARGRIEEWETAKRIAKDYPVFGVGPGNLRVVYGSYSARERLKVTHNSFLQFLVDCGYPGMFLLVGVLALTLYRLQVLRLRSKAEWVRTYARMLQISIMAYVVGGSLLNMAYLDLIYHLVALSVSLEVAAEAMPDAAEVTVQPGDAKPWYLVAPSQSGAASRWGRSVPGGRARK